IDLRRLEESLHVRVEAEHGGTVGGRIAARPFEDARAVVQPVREDMHLCIVPVDERAVEPDFFALAEAPSPINISSRPPPGPITLRMSQFRVEKHRAEAELTLSSGESRRGCFFLALSSASHAGPERVKDVLNFEPGFLPFETAEPVETVLVNR